MVERASVQQACEGVCLQNDGAIIDIKENHSYGDRQPDDFNRSICRLARLAGENQHENKYRRGFVATLIFRIENDYRVNKINRIYKNRRMVQPVEFTMNIDVPGVYIESYAEEHR